MAVKKEVEVSAIEKAKKYIEKAPQKAPSTKPVMEALEDLKPTLEAAFERGYNRDEVLAMLAEKGVEAKPYQLKALFKKEK